MEEEMKQGKSELGRWREEIQCEEVRSEKTRGNSKKGREEYDNRSVYL